MNITPPATPSTHRRNRRRSMSRRRQTDPSVPANADVFAFLDNSAAQPAPYPPHYSPQQYEYPLAPEYPHYDSPPSTYSQQSQQHPNLEYNPWDRDTQPTEPVRHRRPRSISRPRSLSRPRVESRARSRARPAYHERRRSVSRHESDSDDDDETNDNDHRKHYVAESQESRARSRSRLAYRERHRSISRPRHESYSDDDDETDGKDRRNSHVVESQNSGYYEYPDPPTFTKTIEPASAPAPVPSVESKAAKEKEEAAAAAASGGGGILGWLWGGGKKPTPAEEAAKEAAKAKADAEAAKDAAEAAAVKAKELEQKEREEKEQAVYEAERRLRELEEQERQEKEEALYKAERRLRELSRSPVPPTRSRSLTRQKSYGEIAKVSSSKDLVLSPSDLAPTRPPPVSAPASSSKILSLVSKLPSLISKRVEEPPLQLSQEALDTMVSYLYTYMTHLRDLHCPVKSKKHQKSAYELMEKMSLEATHSLFEYLVALKRTPEMRIRFEVGLLEKYSKGDPETESLIVEGLAKVLTGMAGTLGGSVVVPGGWVGDEDE